MHPSNGQGGAPPGATPSICANCGAPDGGELVLCRFCRQPVSAEAARTAIPCPNPQCRTSCRWGKQKCAQCQAWLVVSCVFCGALSPHNVSSCLACNEAFAGAAQRKAQRESERAQQQVLQHANVWAPVAASFLGAVAGSAISSSLSHSSDAVDFDFSGVSDDTSFDFDD